MIDFELQSVYGGWGVIRAPDDIEFTLSTEERSNDLWASIQELLELYVRLRKEESGQVLLGSSAYSEVDIADDRVSFRTQGGVVEGAVEETRDAVERLIVDALSRKDASGGTERRNEKLEGIERHLERKGVECNVPALYHELLDQ